MNLRSRMRLGIPVVFLLLLALPLLAGDIKVGDEITITKKASIDKIVEKSEKFNGRDVRIEGIVTKVCQGSGCWFTLQGKNHEILIKDPHHKVLIPKDSAGKLAVVQGTVRLISPPKERKKQSARCSRHKAKEETDKAHQCPNPKLQINPTGVVLTKPKR